MIVPSHSITTIVPYISQDKHDFLTTILHRLILLFFYFFLLSCTTSAFLTNIFVSGTSHSTSSELVNSNASSTVSKLLNFPILCSSAPASFSEDKQTSHPYQCIRSLLPRHRRFENLVTQISSSPFFPSSPSFSFPITYRDSPSHLSVVENQPPLPPLLASAVPPSSSLLTNMPLPYAHVSFQPFSTGGDGLSVVGGIVSSNPSASGGIATGRKVVLPTVRVAQEANRKVYLGAKKTTAVINDFQQFRNSRANDTLPRFVDLIDEAASMPLSYETANQKLTSPNSIQPQGQQTDSKETDVTQNYVIHGVTEQTNIKQTDIKQTDIKQADIKQTHIQPASPIGVSSPLTPISLPLNNSQNNQVISSNKRQGNLGYLSAEPTLRPSYSPYTFSPTLLPQQPFPSRGQVLQTSYFPLFSSVPAYDGADLKRFRSQAAGPFPFLLQQSSPFPVLVRRLYGRQLRETTDMPAVLETQQPSRKEDFNVITKQGEIKAEEGDQASPKLNKQEKEEESDLGQEIELPVEQAVQGKQERGDKPIEVNEKKKDGGKVHTNNVLRKKESDATTQDVLLSSSSSLPSSFFPSSYSSFSSQSSPSPSSSLPFPSSPLPLPYSSSFLSYSPMASDFHCGLEYHRQYRGTPLISSTQENPLSCLKSCQNTPACTHFTFRPKPFYVCWFFEAVEGLVEKQDVISGPANCLTGRNTDILEGMEVVSPSANPPSSFPLLQSNNPITETYFLPPLLSPPPPPLPPPPPTYSPQPPILASRIEQAGSVIRSSPFLQRLYGQKVLYPPNYGPPSTLYPPYIPLNPSIYQPSSISAGSPLLHGAGTTPIQHSLPNTMYGAAMAGANLFETSQAVMEAGGALMQAFPVQQLVNTGQQLYSSGFFRNRGIGVLGGPGLGVDKQTALPLPGVGRPTVQCHQQGMTCCIPEKAAEDWKTKPPYLNNDDSPSCRGLFVSMQNAICVTTAFDGDNCGMSKTETSSVVIYQHILKIPKRTANNAICECHRKQADGMEEETGAIQGYASWEYSVGAVTEAEEAKKKGERITQGIHSAAAWTKLINSEGSKAMAEITETLANTQRGRENPSTVLKSRL